jgi:hypothetical protein
LGTLYCVLFYLITNIILKRQPHVDVYWQEAIHEFVVTYMGLFVLAWLSILAGAITTWIFTRPEPKTMKYALRVTSIVLPLAIYFSSSTLVNIALKVIPRNKRLAILKLLLHCLIERNLSNRLS